LSTVKKATSKKSSKKSASPSPAALRKYLADTPHYRGKLNGTDVIVLGTAHVSPRSVEDVRKIHELFGPDAVAVELCQPRYEALTDPDRWKNLDIAKVVRERKIWLLASSLILSSFQKRIGDSMGARPGEEMLVAAQQAEADGAELVLADREVRSTLARAWSEVGFFSRIWLISSLFASLLVREELEADQIEELKQQDVFESLLSELPPRYQSVKRVILDERDMYLAESIRQARERLQPKKLFAVIGAGHLPGVRNNLQESDPSRYNLAELSATPKPRRWREILNWSLLGLVALGVSSAFFFWDAEETWRQIQQAALWWAGARMVGSGIGALIARAHPLTALATVLVSPFTFFLGFAGVRLWMVSALTELKWKQPRVEDFESIASDTESFGGFLKALFKNRVLHLFWIILAVSWGLTFGNFFFLYVIVQQIAGA